MRLRARRPDVPEVSVTPTEVPGRWQVDVVARDQVGLLAAIAGAFHVCNLDIVDASITTDETGLLSDRFVVQSEGEPDSADLSREVIDAWLTMPLWEPSPEATVTFSPNDGSTMCEVRATDRPALLRDLAAACRSVGVGIQSAQIATQMGAAYDRFELVDRRGRPLDSATQDAVREAITGRDRSAR